MHLTTTIVLVIVGLALTAGGRLGGKGQGGKGGGKGTGGKGSGASKLGGIDKSPQFSIGGNLTLSNVDLMQTLASRGVSWLTFQLREIQFLPKGKVGNYFAFGYYRYADRGGKGSNLASSATLRADVGLTFLDILTRDQRQILWDAVEREAPMDANYMTARNIAIEELYKLKQSKDAKIDENLILNQTATAGYWEGKLGYDQAVAMVAVLNSMTDSQRALLLPVRTGEYAYNETTSSNSHGDLLGPHSGDASHAGNLRDLSAKAMTFATSTMEQARWTELARYANYFGFATFRSYSKIDSGIGQAAGLRSNAFKKFLEICTEEQKRVIYNATLEETKDMKAILEIHDKILAEIWKLKDGDKAREDRIVQWAETLSRHEGVVALSQAKALSKVYWAFDDAQKTQLAALAQVNSRPVIG
ncbi:uncharacterized protein LOC106165768 [Lingula anatina]|uniref:Uncharacterized protein LOC106165768 n=1 Tax=Lingula anatina TaxID=7574 RepID=A0A1S3IN04_LINAN|nr:uncharacterized protein LOC106165768 [Lingula anatina]|eukprot:XP_013399577.1 uncharacterized protein LOC106165768 [Lingula anatina]